jgi:hypothetical protein
MALQMYRGLDSTRPCSEKSENDHTPAVKIRSNVKMPAAHASERHKREQLALSLLKRALALVEKRSEFCPISLIGMPYGDPLREYAYRISCYESQRRGRPRKMQQPSRKRGAPRKWTRDRYKDLLRIIDIGRAALERKHNTTKVSDAAALAEGVRLWRNAMKPTSEREVRHFVKVLRRRISEAKRLVGDMPKNTV